MDAVVKSIDELLAEGSAISGEALKQFINDRAVGDVDKRAKCNKLLKKAVEFGDIDLVESLLRDAASYVDVNNEVNNYDTTPQGENPRLSINPAYTGWTPLHLAANIMNVSHFGISRSTSSGHNLHPKHLTDEEAVQIQTSVQLGNQQTRALNIIVALWRAKADPCKPAGWADRDVNVLPIDVVQNCEIVKLLLGILMELKLGKVVGREANDEVTDSHQMLMEWACKCGDVDIALSLLERLDDPNAELLEGNILLHMLVKKEEHFEILDALLKKYPNSMKGLLFDRSRAIAAHKMHGNTPISIACRYSNNRFIQWCLRCFSNTLTAIDLYNTGLAEELPLKLFEFVNLKSLNVSKNKLTGITAVEDCLTFQCVQLEEAIFCDNQFTSIPKGLFLLANLRVLNFANNKLNNLNFDGIEINRVPIINMNLSSNNIEVVPSQLFCLPRLAELNLDKNRIADLPVQMWFSPRLVHLSINNNALVELPVPMDTVEERQPEYPSLDSVNVSVVKSTLSCSFRETMMASSGNIEFEEVDINALQSPASQGLQLRKLQLNNNKLQKIPPNLACLAPYLSMLFVANNELEVTPCLRSLPALLKRLDLSRNNLTKFLSYHFGCDDYPLKDCPRKKYFDSLVLRCEHYTHKALVQLNNLNMSYNRIDDDVNTKYNGAFLYYEKLLTLNLSNNEFKTFPDFIVHQPILSVLDISNNLGIDEIPKLIAKLPLISFKYLGISAQVVKTLECFPYDTCAKLRYLRLLMDRTEKNNSIKLMIVGMHHKGKTTLLGHLSRGNFLSSSLSQPAAQGHDTAHSGTVGIAIGVWTYCKHVGNPTNEHPTIEFYSWDYAGQEEYYFTHQLFLHSRTLYLVVWNMLDGEQGIYGLLPWLQGIHAKAPKSEVIIVGTHFDEIEASQRVPLAARYDALIRQSFTNHSNLPFCWPRIAGIHFVGLVEPGFFAQDLFVDELRNLIYETALEMELPMDEFAVDMRAPPKLRIMDELIPVNCKMFYDEIIQRRQQVHRDGSVFPVFEHRYFEYFAEGAGISKDEVDTILLYLRSKGYIFRFEFGEVSKFYFIDPGWLNHIFSLLVSRQHLQQEFAKPGFGDEIVLREHLEQQLVNMEYIQRRHVKGVVRLLEKFHVIVPIDFNQLLVPALLAEADLILVKGNFPRPATLNLQDAPPNHLPKPIATIPSLQLLGTGLVMRRLYVLHGIPIGFWPQLIAHFYIEKIFFDIMKNAITRALRHEDVEESSYAPRWQYSKRSIKLVVNNVILLAIGAIGKDYMDMCQTAQRSEIDLANFHFINSHNYSDWEESNFKFYSGVLVEVNDFALVPSNSEQVVDCTLEMCLHSAELLAFAVETLDALLAEIFHRTNIFDDSSWLKELIPCPLCLGDKRVGPERYPEIGDIPVTCCNRHQTVHDLSQERDVVYYFTINHCLTQANTGRISCPKHGYLVLECLAPDLIFQDMTSRIYTDACFSQPYKQLDREESGSFGNVYKDHKNNIAAKIIKAQTLSGLCYLSHTYKIVRKEIDKLLYFKAHPHIVQVLGVLVNPYGIVLELAPIGDLQSAVIDKYRYRNNLLCATAVLLTVKQISSALAYFHEQRIIHRDVKPKNVLVFSYPDENHISINNPQNWNCEVCLSSGGGGVLVKLSDFGIGVRVTAFQHLAVAGSPGYRAPEISGISSATGYDEKVDIYSLAMTLYVMLTLRHVPLKGIPQFEQLIMAGRRPKFATMDPLYPLILYECIHHCWQQEQTKRPSASTIVQQLSTFRYSLLSRYPLEAPSSLSAATVMFTDNAQSLWSVMEYPGRVQDHPEVRRIVKLTSIHQYNASQLEVKDVDSLPSDVEIVGICQLNQWVVVGYADQMAVYDAIMSTQLTPYKLVQCPKCACSLQCLEPYPNNTTTLFSGQSFGSIHLLTIGDIMEPDNWVKYCYELSGEVLATMRVCSCDTHVELWCSTATEYVEILQFPIDVADCNHGDIQANIVQLRLPATGLVTSIECCVTNDEMLVFMATDRATTVTCWNGSTKELVRNICFNEPVMCIKVVEPKLYIGMESGDTTSASLECITSALESDYRVLPHTPLERYCHRRPVQALVGAYGSVGHQGNLIRLFSNPEGMDHHGNMFRQEVACSLVLSIGYGYQSPWNSSNSDTEDDDQYRNDNGVEEQDNDMCLLVHLVC